MLSGCSRVHSARLGPRSMGAACEPNEPYQEPARPAAESSDDTERCGGGGGAGHGPDTRQSVQLRDRGLASFARSHRARRGPTRDNCPHCHTLPHALLRPPDGPPHPTLHWFSRLLLLLAADADPTAIHGRDDSFAMGKGV
ncbi:hypothetical protein HPB50_015273 [Hyalomma asiaticum]|uniref:Uncharacterized protein n=1 Tax=Hyalomma asiaticum TaxID=266040 RepID=A0ACB7RIW7_HYAAI|nr:hypothetical protein HPB50_015273 [Hyalomma asiaticum]